MKKFLFVITILLIIISLSCVVASVFCIADFTTYYNSVADNPASDGIDFLLIGMGHGLLLAGFAVVGFVCSLVLKLMRKTKFFKIYSIAGMVVFSVLIVVAAFVFFA